MTYYRTTFDEPINVTNDDDLELITQWRYEDDHLSLEVFKDGVLIPSTTRIIENEN